MHCWVGQREAQRKKNEAGMSTGQCMSSSTVTVRPAQASSTAATSEQGKSESPHYQLFKSLSDSELRESFPEGIHHYGTRLNTPAF